MTTKPLNDSPATGKTQRLDPPGTKRKDGTPDANERSRIRARLTNLGYSASDLAALVKSGMTRGELADDLLDRQKKAKKAE